MLCANSGFAERGARRSSLALGFLGGFSMSNNVNSGSTASLSSVTDLAFGFSADISLEKNWALEIDLLSIAKGFNSTEAGVPTNYGVRYLQLPVQLRYYASPNVAIHFGPYLASLVIAANRSVGGTSEQIKGAFANDFGLTGGLWLGFPASKRLTVGLDTRFDLGLADIEADNDPSSIIRTRAIIFLSSFIFSL